MQVHQNSIVTYQMALNLICITVGLLTSNKEVGELMHSMLFHGFLI